MTSLLDTAEADRLEDWLLQVYTNRWEVVPPKRFYFCVPGLKNLGIAFWAWCSVKVVSPGLVRVTLNDVHWRGSARLSRKKQETRKSNKAMLVQRGTPAEKEDAAALPCRAATFPRGSSHITSI